MAKEYSQDPGSKDSGVCTRTNPQALGASIQGKGLNAGTEQNQRSGRNRLRLPCHESGEARGSVLRQAPADQKEGIRNELASAKIDNFMQNELNDLIESMNLPKSENADKPAEGTGDQKTDGTTDKPAEGDQTPDAGKDDTGK